MALKPPSPGVGLGLLHDENPGIQTSDLSAALELDQRLRPVVVAAEHEPTSALLQDRTDGGLALEFALRLVRSGMKQQDVGRLQEHLGDGSAHLLLALPERPRWVAQDAADATDPQAIDLDGASVQEVKPRVLSELACRL